MTHAWIFALAFFIVGLVFAVINKEYRTSTFWFFLTLIWLSGLPYALRG